MSCRGKVRGAYALFGIGKFEFLCIFDVRVRLRARLCLNSSVNKFDYLLVGVATLVLMLDLRRCESLHERDRHVVISTFLFLRDSAT